MLAIKRGRKLLFACILGIIISFCYVGGKQLDIFDAINFFDKTFYFKWLGWSIPATVLVYCIFELFAFFERKQISQKESKMPTWVLFCVGVVVLLLCYLPVWLSLFPGAFSYDAYDEWLQVKNLEITSHHPVVHVLLLGGLVEGLYSLTGDYNVGIAVYTGLQMLLLSCALSYTVCFLKEMKMPKTVQIGTLLFYALSPVCGLFSISATKDILFTAAEMIFFIFCLRILTKPDEFFVKKGWKIGFVLSTLGTMILRNNGFYVAMIMLLLIGILCRKYWKKYVWLLVAIMLPYMIYTGPFYSMLEIEKGGVQEMLSVPIQQMARVHHTDRESIAPEDLELLYQYIPKENLENYKSTVADPVKIGFDGEYFKENKAQFFKLWLRLGLDNPLTYINSFLTNTVDFWCPNAIVDGYQDAYGKSSYFDYRVAEPGTEIVFFSKVHEFYEDISWNKEAQAKPLAFLFLSPGWYFVCILIMFFYLVCSKRYKPAMAMLVFVLSYLTVLLGPMALVRYVLIFYYGVPVIVALCIQRLEGEENR